MSRRLFSGFYVASATTVMIPTGTKLIAWPTSPGQMVLSWRPRMIMNPIWTNGPICRVWGDTFTRLPKPSTLESIIQSL